MDVNTSLRLRNREAFQLKHSLRSYCSQRTTARRYDGLRWQMQSKELWTRKQICELRNGYSLLKVVKLTI